MLSKERVLFYLPATIIIILSCLLIGFSFYIASKSISIPIFITGNLDDDLSVGLTKLSDNISNTLYFTYSVISRILVITAATLFISICFLIMVLFYWGKDRQKILHWKEIGFLCERLEFLEANKIKLNQTELLLNQSQYYTLERLVDSRIEGKPLHSIDIGDNATQTIKRLREELGSKLIERTLIMNHRGKGYWININPKKIKLNKDN